MFGRLQGDSYRGSAGREAAPEADVFIEARRVEADSILEGIRSASAQRVLVLRGDMALASAEAISDLLAYAPDSSLVYPVIEESDMKSDFPERSPYYLRTTDGRYTGASCMLFEPRAALSDRRLVGALLEARQNPVALLGLVGPLFAAKAIITSVGLADFEAHLSERCNFSCRVFVSHYPELFISIDSPGDVVLMEQALGEV